MGIIQHSNISAVVYVFIMTIVNIILYIIASDSVLLYRESNLNTVYNSKYAAAVLVVEMVGVVLVEEQLRDVPVLQPGLEATANWV